VPGTAAGNCSPSYWSTNTAGHLPTLRTRRVEMKWRRKMRMAHRTRQGYGKTRVTVNQLLFSASPLPVGRGDSAQVASVYIDSGFAIVAH
jgi:hypothetical protein